MNLAVALAEKSPEAFRTISEVATELDVPQHVLRFWETRFAQIRPVKRAGGRRYYRPDDIDLLRGIRALLYSDGYTIKGVQRILREQGIRHVAEVGRQPPRPKTSRGRDLPGREQRPVQNGDAGHEGTSFTLLAMGDGVATPDDAARAKLKDVLQDLHRMKKKLRAVRERTAE